MVQYLSLHRYINIYKLKFLVEYFVHQFILFVISSKGKKYLFVVSQSSTETIELSSTSSTTTNAKSVGVYSL